MGIGSCKAECTGKIGNQLGCHGRLVGTEHGFVEFGIGDSDSQTLVFTAHESFGDEAVESFGSHCIGAEVATVALVLFRNLGYTVLISLVIDADIAGFCHSCGRAEIGATGCEEVAQDECKQCHDDDYEQQHRLVSDFL